MAHTWAGCNLNGMAFLMSFGVVYWLINANKPRQYRLFISLKILKTGIFCADLGAFFCLTLIIAPLKRSGVLWYYTMKFYEKSYVYIPKQYHNNTIV